MRIEAEKSCQQHSSDGTTAPSSLSPSESSVFQTPQPGTPQEASTGTATPSAVPTGATRVGRMSAAGQVWLNRETLGTVAAPVSCQQAETRPPLCCPRETGDLDLRGHFFHFQNPVLAHSRMHAERQRNQERQHSFGKNNVGGVTLPNFENYSKVTVIRTRCYWRRRQTLHQRSGGRSPETDSYEYGHLICDKDTKAIQRRKDSLLDRWCQNQ